MKTKIIQNIKSIILALILVAGISYVSAYSTWSGPTATAPSNNADKPLDVSNNGQTKAGGLTLNTGGAANGLIVQSGNVGIGTTSPTNKLDILGGVYWGDVSGKGFLGYSGNNAIVGAGSGVGGSLILKANGTDTGYITNGNVGIGIPSPTQKLDVNGYVKGTGLCIGNDCKTAWPGGGGSVGTLSCTVRTGSLVNCLDSVTSGSVSCVSGEILTGGGCSGGADHMSGYPNGNTYTCQSASCNGYYYSRAVCCKIQ